MTQLCQHFDTMTAPVEPRGNRCEQCVAMGDTWVHLRACLACGAVGCCDQSKNRHARAHWHEHDHALIRSVEPGETWRFCFPDELTVP